MIERRIIQPVHDWIDLHEHVQKTVAKRDRKLIDYDRHRESLKSAKEKAGEKGGEDPKKIQKVC